jgi:hypothetical protein
MRSKSVEEVDEGNGFNLTLPEEDKSHFNPHPFDMTKQAQDLSANFNKSTPNMKKMLPKLDKLRQSPSIKALVQ